MTNTDLEMFMAKLKMLVYDPASTGNNQFIEAKRPEIGFLYGELSYLYAIGIRFKDTTIGEEQLHGLEDVGNLTRRLFKAVQEAEDIVDMFISSAMIKNDFMAAPVFQNPLNYYHKSAYLTLPSESSFTQRKLTYLQQEDHVFITYIFNRSLQDLKDVMDGLKSIREEIMSNYYNDRGNLLQNLLVNQQEMMMMDNKIAATGTTVNLSATEHEEFIVGFDDDALLILDRLTGDRKKLDIISIVGMGGLGKTTLATKIFNDSLVEYYFDIRGWVNMSQAYSKRDMLVKLLASIGKSVHAATSESKLCETLYQSLKGRKYLMVIDDLWSCKSWDDVASCFPDDKTGSRVLVATRLTEVASHTSQGGFTHNLRLLTEEQRKHIAKKCGGLPLAIVVIAGLLEKGEKRKDLWEKIAESVGSYIVNDPKGCLDTLALSYDHLPCHLKKCFLYVGGFPEGYEVRVQTLIRLWMAEGFIKESGQRGLEEEGKSYLMDLIDRNLLIVAGKSSNGGVKSCRLHDLLRHLCLKKADEINFLKKVSTSALGRNSDSDSVSRVVKQRRLFTDKDVLTNIYSRYFPTHTRSVLCFDDRGLFEHKTASWIPSFLLLRVLDLLNIPMFKFSKIRMLVHLRYLAVWVCDHDSSFLNANFLRLETLIVKGNSQSVIYPSENIVNLSQLRNIRHLRCDGITIPRDFTVPTLSKLRTISRLILDHGTYLLLKYFPDIKKLGCSVCSTSSNDGLLRLEGVGWSPRALSRHVSTT
ncbi:late blight resistance protein R1-A-like [Helianthus annuus]|uniref:late blight resistance protein R1-A-like n=1 Tax=Helianthus annuus TaxID=4232 RepID=UPI0016530A9A|nr:late blight resistance protein R1-A-like [Helianthus annuus]